MRNLGIKAFAATAAAAGIGAGAIAAGGFLRAVRRQDRTPQQWDRRLHEGKWADWEPNMRSAMAWYQAQEKEEVFLTSRDGLRLRGAYLEAPEAKGCVLLFHGFRSCGEFDFSLVLPMFYENGYSTLLVDQRSHNRSQGRYIGYGILERYDCQRWAWFLHNKLEGRLPIFLEGLSMGASTVMMASDLPMPPSVRGIIADCGFNSAWDEIGHCIRQWYHVPPAPLLYLTDLACQAVAGYSLKETTAANALSHSKLPILFVHGTGDDFVPASMTEENYMAAAGKKRRVLVDKAGHGLSYLMAEEQCREALLRFLRDYSEGYQKDGGNPSI